MTAPHTRRLRSRVVKSGTVSKNQNLQTDPVVPMASSATKLSSANSSANDKKPTLFFDLPLKLRQKIYTLAFGSGRYTLFAGTRHPTLMSTGEPHMLVRPAIPGALCSRLRINREALEIFYAVNQFTINGPMDKQLFSTTNGQVARQHMADIAFEECVYPSPSTRCRYRIIARVENAKLELLGELTFGLFCICDMKVAMHQAAIQRAADSDGQIGLAYAAIEFFSDEYMPGIQDKIVKGVSYSLRCDDCRIPEAEENWLA
ncbi:hypothetical protein LTR10_002653 [Elasticomyces elasticus]|nr:hypothetical protein LTR10_002653 [Elasticomyces elasticus]KAK4968003.1 hypothetical protein LTR42_010333 [Elasticomyces elasticus]